MKSAEKEQERKYTRICLFLTEQEAQKLYEVMYKERLMPAKIMRRALMEYIDRVLQEQKDEEPITL